MRLQLDWAFQSPNAFALVARERGFFREAGVDVAVERGTGSGRVPVQLASGAADIGCGDIKPAIRFAIENPDSGLLCVAVLLDRSPLCAILRADGPVRAPKDLEGRALAAPEFDAGRILPGLRPGRGHRQGQGRFPVRQPGAARAHDAQRAPC